LTTPESHIRYHTRLRPFLGRKLDNGNPYAPHFKKYHFTIGFEANRLLGASLAARPFAFAAVVHFASL
jgi:hypothetical protein